MVVMTGPETGLRELAKAIRWECAYQAMTLFDHLLQDSLEARRQVVDHPGEFRFMCEIQLGWHP